MASGGKKKRRSWVAIFSHTDLHCKKRCSEIHTQIDIWISVCCRHWHHVITISLVMLPDEEKHKHFTPSLHPTNNDFFLLYFFLCVYLKEDDWSFYILTNPPQSLFPFLLISLTNLLLQKACISSTVDLYLCSLCFISPPIHLSCTVAFSFHPPLLPPAPPLSLSVFFCNLSVFPIVAVISQIWEGRKALWEKKKLRQQSLWGFLPFVAAARECICFTKRRCPK